MHLVKSAYRVLIGLLLGMLFAACASSSSEAPTFTPNPTASHTPTPTLTATRAPTSPTPTPTATVTLTPSPPPPTETPAQTLSPIQQTEQYVYGQLTAQANTATAQAPPTLTPTPTASDTPTITPTPFLPDALANAIVFSSTRAGTRDIWVMNLDGGNPAPLVLLPGSDEFSADCSPQGRGFVFDSDRGDDREIYLGGFGGVQARPLTDTPGENYAPRWSPDDTRIVFVSTRDGNPDIWWMDSGGGNVQRLTDHPGPDEMPTWSPDGQRILYTSERADGQRDIYAYDLASGSSRPLLQSPARDETHPLLSPDSETLTFIARAQADIPDTAALWMETAPGSGLAQIVFSATGQVDTPAWIAQDHALVSADLGGITHILLVNVQNQRQSILTNLGPSNLQPRPCNIPGRDASRALPLGEQATPTPTPTLVRASDYTAVINPGADWATQSVTLSRATLAGLAPEDYGTRLTLTPVFMVYRWEDAANNAHVLTLAPEAREGALRLRAVRYTVNNLDVDIALMDDLRFMLREGILANSLPAGAYHIQSLSLSDDALQLTLQTPPDE